MKIKEPIIRNRKINRLKESNFSGVEVVLDILF